jgi:hypothetical protein
VIPELIGLSLGFLEDRVTLTLVASADQLAALDAVQHLDGGRCVTSVDRAEVVDVNIGDLRDEERWRLRNGGIRNAQMSASDTIRPMSTTATTPKALATTVNGWVRHHSRSGASPTVNATDSPRSGRSSRRTPSSTPVTVTTASSVQSRHTRAGGAEGRGSSSRDRS